ncbi:MAG: hypothetical protein IKF07_02720 [Eubacterium sp.]|nr:hypothetical protein [Eubacterium sp.]
MKMLARCTIKAKMLVRCTIKAKMPARCTIKAKMHYSLQEWRDSYV